MYTNGEIIASINGHTENSPYLVNRILEIYVTKTKVKFYLFNSSSKNWHKEYNILDVIETKLDENINQTLRFYIKSIMYKYDIKFNDKFKYNGELFVYEKGLETYQTDSGYRAVDSKGYWQFFGKQGESGIYYKDYNAWKNGFGVIYIGEYQLNDLNNKVITTDELWTKNSWCEWVKDYITSHYSDEEYFDKMIKSKEFIESLAYDCLICGDWRDLTTILDDLEINDDMTIYDKWIEFCSK